MRARVLLLWRCACRGDVAKHRGDTRCVYSRCIRQTLYNISKAQKWHEQVGGGVAGAAGRRRRRRAGCRPRGEAAAALAAARPASPALAPLLLLHTDN